MRRADEPWPVEEPDPIAARRAAAADEGVALAAAGMSAGVSTDDGVAGDSAAPATTLLGVEEADTAEFNPPGKSEISEEDVVDWGEPGVADLAEADPDLADAQADSPAGSPADDSEEPDALADHWSDALADGDPDHPGEDDLRPGTRPLGSAPLLDSEPLPATKPGMLRPRQVEGFSLPAQRPAFDIGPEEPADIS